MSRADEIAAAETAEHLANGPETWQVVKAAERCWQVRRTDGAVITTCKTQKAARAETAGGFYVNLWHKRARWMRGEPMHPWKPYAECVAEKVRNEQAQALFASFRAAGYKRAFLDERDAGKRCCGGLELLDEHSGAWEDGNGWLWCRMHLTELLTEPATAGGNQR